MKNSIQTSTILLVMIASFFFGSQVNAQGVKLQDFDTNKNSIYISPLNLLNPFGASAQITYGRVLANGNEVQFSYGQRLKISSTAFLLSDENELFYHFHMPRSKSGFRIGGEYQMNFYSKKGKKNYFGVEGYYDLHKMVYWEKAFKIIDAEAPQIIRTKLGLNFKLGRKIKLGDRLFLDVYAGLGIKYLDFKYKETKINVEDKEEISDLGKGVGLAFPINIKFAYTI